MSIKINKHDDRTMFLQQHVGDADAGDIHISLGTCLATGSLIAMAKKAGAGTLTTYTLAMRDFIHEVLLCEVGESEANFVKRGE